MIRGERASLREVRDGDWDVLGAIRNDTELQRQLMSRPRASSAERVVEWVTRLSSDPAALFFVVADATTDRATGFVQIVGIDLVSGHGRLGVAIAPAEQGRGLARDAIELAGEHARAVFGLRKIVLDVLVTNTRAIDLYRSIGFVDVGVLRAHFTDGGEHHDVLVMERFLTEGR